MIFTYIEFISIVCVSNEITKEIVYRITAKSSSGLSQVLSPRFLTSDILYLVSFLIFYECSYDEGRERERKMTGKHKEKIRLAFLCLMA